MGNRAGVRVSVPQKSVQKILFLQRKKLRREGETKEVKRKVAKKSHPTAKLRKPNDRVVILFFFLNSKKLKI